MTTVNEPVRRVITPAGDQAWQVTGYDDVKALLADPRLGRSHPDPEHAARLSESMIFGRAEAGDPDTERTYHTMWRSMLSPAFSARRMEALKPRVQELLDGLLDEMSMQAPPVDFHEAVSFPLPALVISELLGVPPEDRERFRRWSDDAAHLRDGERSRSGLDQLKAYMRELAERKRREPGEDVISDMVAVQARVGDMFPDDALTLLASGLLFAGHETTVAAIDQGVVLMLTNPISREALARGPAAVAQAVEEILRIPDPTRRGRPDVGGVPRWTNADIEVAGVTIPAGDLVLLATWAANTDERVFAEPRAFDVSRADNRHVTFGHGPHFCLGAPLARIELQVVFGTLFDRFPTLRLAVSVEELSPKSDLLTGGVKELPVAW